MRNPKQTRKVTLPNRATRKPVTPALEPADPLVTIPWPVLGSKTKLNSSTNRINTLMLCSIKYVYTALCIVLDQNTQKGKKNVLFNCTTRNNMHILEADLFVNQTKYYITTIMKKMKRYKVILSCGRNSPKTSIGRLFFVFFFFLIGSQLCLRVFTTSQDCNCLVVLCF